MAWEQERVSAMKSKTVHDFFRSSIGAGALVGAAMSVVMSTPAWSEDFEKGDFSLSWYTLAYGLNLRTGCRH